MNAIQAEDYVHTMLMVGLEAKAIKKKGRSIKSLKKEKKKKSSDIVGILQCF